jgi:hypothetical protein
VKPDPDGSCETVPIEGAEWTVSGTPLRLEPCGDEVLLHPPGALVGIGIRDAANEQLETVAWKRRRRACVRPHAVARVLSRAAATDASLRQDAR